MQFLPTRLRRPVWTRGRTGPATKTASRGGFPSLRMFGSFFVIALVIGLGGALLGRLAPAAPAFDPSGPCVADGSKAGAYPDLEARLPNAFEGRKADQLDSGRNCTNPNLATLLSHGIHELRFAGGLWAFGQDKGVRLAVFQATGLTGDFMSEWFEAGAQTATHTQAINTDHPTVNGRPGYRLDAINGDARQSVIVWPSSDGQVIQVVMASDVPEDSIQAAIKAFG